MHSMRDYLQVQHNVQVDGLEENSVTFQPSNTVVCTLIMFKNKLHTYLKYELHFSHIIKYEQTFNTIKYE